MAKRKSSYIEAKYVESNSQYSFSTLVKLKYILRYKKNKHNIILESLSEKNYNSRVRRDFFDKEEQAAKRPCISLNVSRFYHQ